MKIAEILETKFDQILRDERVLSLLSKNINIAVSLQKNATKRLESFLAIADIPTLRGLNDLFKSVNELEKLTMVQREEIENLKGEIAKLKTEKIIPIVAKEKEEVTLRPTPKATPKKRTNNPLYR